MSHTQTSVPPPPTTKSKKRTCCAGKKLVTYSCKVWCMVAVCVLLIAAASVLMYVLLSKNSTGQPEKVLALPKKPDWFPECLRELENPLERFNCYPEDRFVGKSACEARGCCYLNLTIPGELIEYGNRTFVSDKMPHCVYPKNYGYVAAGKTTSTFNGFVLPLQRVPAPSRFGDDTQVVNMLVEMQTKHRLRIKIYNKFYQTHCAPQHPYFVKVWLKGRDIFLEDF
ncbi:sucrase-isomaltase, intestinal [Caerostris darwini]|uniref:Sucrase-isomaltase, intestinal n=1 Tax=Caerostris darwini TaxID=1538125 RepID=A0AAV4SDK5_9ARAC|nr:sucrase-isomaltase, intestinal [Caerostris darwini]